MSWFKESEFWKEWASDCHNFDKSIQNLWVREDLTDDKKVSSQVVMLENFNKKMNNKFKGKLQ